ncbi:MAG TPA: hypothetical protein VNO79_12235 [Actinomycetota bacterium]|nr:hypothetical protein [Actinomycetota bacterium]
MTKLTYEGPHDVLVISWHERHGRQALELDRGVPVELPPELEDFATIVPAEVRVESA